MQSRNGEAPSRLQVVRSINGASLLATAKSGEAAAVDTLYRAHAEKLFRTVHRITRNREDAEDAVQDSFLRAFLHLKSFDGRSTFSTWLTRIGINSALMILRKKRNSSEMSAHRAGVDEALWEVPDSAPKPEIRCAEREREFPRFPKFDCIHHGSGPTSFENVPVGPFASRSARRTGSRAPSSTVRVPV